MQSRRALVPKAGVVRGPLGVSDRLVGEDGDAVPDGLRVEEAHRFLVAGVAEEARADGCVADGARGLPDDAPFDAIVLSGSTHAVPQALLQQLAPGGRLIGIVGDEPAMRAVRVQRLADSRLETQDLFDTVAQRLRGFDEPSRFHF